MFSDNAEHEDAWELTHSYDRSTERPSEVVVRTVAFATNRDALSIEPLYRAIEPEAMDDVITGDDPSTSMSFHYAGCRVYVDDDTVGVHALGEAIGE